jgi:isoleucyl-tRNA synthetase
MTIRTSSTAYLPLPQKDIVTRYASCTGHHVIRRFGWDCHGLPVEHEIDKKLGG